MKNTEIFYFDVDGTILDNETDLISPETIDSINKLQSLGYKIAISTGRPAGAFKDHPVRSIANWDAYILSNGGVTLDKDFNVRKNITIDPQTIHTLIENYKDTILLEGEDVYLVNGASQAMVDLFAEINMELPPVIEYDNQEVQKFIITNFDAIEGGFDHPVFEGLTYEINAHGRPELYPEESGKHIAIRNLNKELGITSYTYFGDGNNDAQAIKNAAVGVAMGNAFEEAIKHSDYVTTKVSDNGITNALKHYGIIE